MDAPPGRHPGARDSAAVKPLGKLQEKTLRSIAVTLVAAFSMCPAMGQKAAPIASAQVVQEVAGI